MSLPPQYEREEPENGGFAPPTGPTSHPEAEIPFAAAATSLDTSPVYEDTTAEEAPEHDERSVMYRAAGGDQTFGYVIAIALSVGLLPLIPHSADVRYVVVWGVLALFGVLAWLLGDTERIERDVPENLVWGVVFGMMIGVPLLLVATGTLATTARLLFRSAIGGEIQPLSTGSVLAFLVFVQPTAETLFFRGVFQHRRPFWLVGLLASLWSAVLFFPMLDIGLYPLVGVVIGVALVMMNIIYSYVRVRNGLAAAWLCQITLNIILLFVPFIAA